MRRENSKFIFSSKNLKTKLLVKGRVVNIKTKQMIQLILRMAYKTTTLCNKVKTWITCQICAFMLLCIPTTQPISIVHVQRELDVKSSEYYRTHHKGNEMENSHCTCGRCFLFDKYLMHFYNRLINNFFN